MCNNIKNIVDPQIYAKIRILKCGSVTAEDIDSLSEQFSNLSVSSPQNMPQIQKKVSEAKPEESFGLDKLFSEEDIVTISNVTGMEDEDALIATKIVDDAAKNNVLKSLDEEFDREFNYYGLVDLFSNKTTLKPPDPVSAPPVVARPPPAPPVPVVPASVPVIPASAPATVVPVVARPPPAPPVPVASAAADDVAAVDLLKDTDINKLKQELKKNIPKISGNFNFQEIKELQVREEPEKPMSRYQKFYAMASNMGNMVSSSLDIIQPYKTVIKYKNNIISVYSDSREHLEKFFNYIIEGFKLIITAVPRLCYELSKLLAVSLFNLIKTGVINIKNILKNIYEITSNYFINPTLNIASLAIIGITTYCIPGIINLYRYLSYGIYTTSLKTAQLTTDGITTSINIIVKSIKSIGSLGINFCHFLYIFLSECFNIGINNISTMWNYITDFSKNIVITALKLTGQIISTIALNTVKLAGFILSVFFKGLLMLITLIPFNLFYNLFYSIRNMLIEGIATVTATLINLFRENHHEFSDVYSNFSDEGYRQFQEDFDYHQEPSDYYFGADERFRYDESQDEIYCTI